MTPGDTAWTGVPSKASGAAPMSHVVADAPCCGGALRRLPGPRVKDWKPKTAATGAARRTKLVSDASFGAPTSRITPGRKAAEGFGVGPQPAALPGLSHLDICRHGVLSSNHHVAAINADGPVIATALERGQAG